jgi:hypothetical protein
MLCTYDQNGQVVSLRPVSPLDKFPNGAGGDSWAPR